MRSNSVHFFQTSLLIILLGSLVACMPRVPKGQRAPMVEYHTGSGGRHATATPVSPVPRLPDPAQETVAQSYVVQKGDTLYSIAFAYGVDYLDIAEWNGLDNPSSIRVGQRLRLNVPVTTTLTNVEIRPIYTAQSVEVTPLPSPGAGKASDAPLKTGPKVGKIPYSSRAMAQAGKLQGEEVDASSEPVRLKPTTTLKSAEPEESVDWALPTRGKVVAGFSENESRKGVDIAGERGQAISASAAGKVVYSGSGLRGYGKLVIIKHNNTFLSAYAHNDRILVKEGQNVTRGQKIAEMGNSDADQVKLHFEIRKLGKPVDPAQYLPLTKS